MRAPRRDVKSQANSVSGTAKEASPGGLASIFQGLRHKVGNQPCSSDHFPTLTQHRAGVRQAHPSARAFQYGGSELERNAFGVEHRKASRRLFHRSSSARRLAALSHSQSPRAMVRIHTPNKTFPSLLARSILRGDLTASRVLRLPVAPRRAAGAQGPLPRSAALALPRPTTPLEAALREN